MTKTLNKSKPTNSREIAIKVENLSKTFQIPHEKQSSLKGSAVNLFKKGARGYEIFHALEDINFEVKRGEFFGIIGRNGSGKSTLLKILAGIYVPDKNHGNIIINGKLSPFLELGVGFNPELTGRENIFLGGTVLGLTKKQIQDRYEKIVAFSELEEFIDMKLKNYSSGMQVRLAFSLSINVEAEILLMDEVLAVGDTNFQNKCLAEFARYKKEGKTVVLVTHDIGTVQRYCDRAMLISSGKVISVGNAEEVGDEYTHRNMLDEKKRDIQATTSPTPSAGPKSAKIVKVVLMNGKMEETETFGLGEDICCAIFHKQEASVKDIYLGVAIFDSAGLCITGFNTVFDKNLKLNNSKNVLVIKNTYFKKGNYTVKAGLFYGVGATSIYDFKEIAARFSYKNNSLNVGVIDAEYEWEK